MLSRVACLAVLSVAAGFAGPTYRDVAPILQEKCQRCHRPNDIAPFALMNYEDARTWAADIRTNVANGVMPPWKPVAGYGDFVGAYNLTADEKQVILDWADQGAVEGDPLPTADAPTDASASLWRLGDPDLVLKMPQYTPPRSGDTYRCFVLPTGVDASRYVTAYQINPGEKQTVHHVLLYVDQSGEADALDGKDGQPGYTCFGGPVVSIGIGGLLGGWAPGAQPARLPDGIGNLLPGNARVIMQVHYHPSGKTLPDQTSVGFYFAPDGAVQKRLVNIPIVNTSFTIPAGASNYTVKASVPVLPFLTGKAITVAPHMHLLGRQIRLDMSIPGKGSKPLIYIDNWDFNWQGFYTFQEPVDLPSGATVTLTAVFDNSENNPKNPNNPIVPVKWGEGTNDEMALGFVGVVFDNDSLFSKRK